ncbi:hypothetical protein THAOC_36805 [Thalassiosira oceanica]|uniref:Helicase-associated domain-containing protein n=1 Tax=Thalassiosira oceanica TaxID=159749 RepID=K0RDQ8_THAOC|nr:hypothetical protein THAOC_36805 [Thalassiosira oceanica]|eukprot:EJK44642.1 hypothetical protein THAOC_36805 [Thalassiosira oceanica]
MYSYASHGETWDERFDELTHYKAGHGHCNVPRNEGSLGQWVINQRKAEKKGKLSDARKLRLDGIGFELEKPEEKAHFKVRAMSMRDARKKGNSEKKYKAAQSQRSAQKSVQRISTKDENLLKVIKCKMKNQARKIAQHQSTTGDSDSPDDSGEFARLLDPNPGGKKREEYVQCLFYGLNIRDAVPIMYAIPVLSRYRNGSARTVVSDLRAFSEKKPSSLRVTLAALENMLPSPHREIVPGEYSMPRNGPGRASAER